MATALLDKGMPDRESMPAVAGELWRVTGQHGFNTPRNKRKNETTRIEFSSRIQAFASRLDNMGSNECTWRTLDVILRVDRKPLEAFSRKMVVSVELVNELTIVWACTFIRMGFRGLIRPGILDLLKKEVIWLLWSLKYKLPMSHVLFCPFMTKWEDQKNWNVLESNEFRTKNFPAKPVNQESLPSVCVECIANTKTAQS